eukprot:TRINITY_DN9335_c0_g1_i1.p1 TRINITY_DN9335_c0_g1~~TRINITY_DN9335_c0_g1_i1.p1  ORF type:complete len:1590 (-),score=252.70 TRINITY_DN9335_c0_g1_i1:42-4811(-)
MQSPGPGTPVLPSIKSTQSSFVSTNSGLRNSSFNAMPRALSRNTSAGSVAALGARPGSKSSSKPAKLIDELSRRHTVSNIRRGSTREDEEMVAHLLGIDTLRRREDSDDGSDDGFDRDTSDRDLDAVIPRPTVYPLAEEYENILVLEANCGREPDVLVLSPPDTFESAAQQEMEEEMNAAVPSCPQLITQNEELLPVTLLEYDVDIQLGIASASVNVEWLVPPTTLPLNCLLVLPMRGVRPVMHKCKISMGNRLIETMIVHCDSLQERHTASQFPQGSLLDSTGWTPSVFRLAFANVASGITVRAELEYSERLLFEGHKYTFRLPLAFPTPTIAEAPLRDILRLNLRVNLGTNTLWDCSHPVVATPGSEATALQLVLDDARAWPNREFFVHFCPCEVEILPLAHITSIPDLTDDDGFSMQLLSLTVCPPTSPHAVFPRRAVVLLNHTHSLRGELLRDMVQGIAELLRSLQETDQFLVVIFELGRVVTQEKTPELLDGTPEATSKTLEWLEEFFADELNEEPPGPDSAVEPDIATQLMEAVQLALSLLPAVDSYQVNNSVFLLSDCEVGEDIERDVCVYVGRENDGRVRFHTLGIGLDCNPPFLWLLSELTQGNCEICVDPLQAGASLTALLRRTREPILMDLHFFVKSSVEMELFPENPPDLYSDTPVQVCGRFFGTAPPTVLVTGFLPSGLQYCRTVPVVHQAVDMGKIFSVSTLDRFTSYAWFSQSQNIDADTMSLSCQVRTPCVGWTGSTSMVMIDYSREKQADIAATYGPKLRVLGQRGYNSYLMDIGVLDREVVVVGSTALVVESLASTRLGKFQAEMRATESLRAAQLTELVQEEEVQRLQLARDSDAQLENSTRNLLVQLAQFDRQKRHLVRQEAAARRSLEMDEQQTYLMLRRVTSQPALLVHKATAKTPVMVNGLPVVAREVLHSSSLMRGGKEEGASPSYLPSVATLVRALESQEAIQRRAIDFEQGEQFQQVQNQAAQQARQALRRSKQKRAAEKFPNLCRKWANRSTRSPSDAATLSATTNLQQSLALSSASGASGEGSSGEQLWRALEKGAPVSAQDVTWLLSLLRHNPQDVGLIGEILELLGLWCGGDKAKDNVAILAGQGVVSELCRVSRQHTTNLVVQQRAASLMQVLSSSSKAQPAMEREGGVATVLQALRQNPTDQELVCSCLKVITNLSQVGASSRWTLASKGAVSLVLRAMVSFQYRPDTLALAITALGALGITTDVATEIQNSIAMEGGVDLVFQAMQAYPSHSDILAASVQCLDHLSAFNNFNKSLLMSGGATSLILSSMMAFPENPKLLFHAISALTTLASNIYAREAIVNQGGVGLIAACVGGFPSHRPNLKLLTKARNCVEILQRVERADGISGSIAQNPIRFVRCSFVADLDKRPETKLIGYSGSIQRDELQQSVLSTFELGADQSVVLRYVTDSNEEVTLSQENISLLLAAAGTSGACPVITVVPESLLPRYMQARNPVRPNTSAESTVVARVQQPAKLVNKGIQFWSEVDVQNWITHVVGLPQYAPVFARLHTTGAALVGFTPNTLFAQNITNRKDITKILKSIEQFRSESSSGPGAAATV